ncbi:MAG TPA: Gfo/Idh/MocA family oxidoreductase [Chloroflexota bacterium]|jgi:predicted dehydrogenase
MTLVELRPDDYRPVPTPEDIRQRFGIALVGCGNIARHAHLPAYRNFGYRVVAACDVVAENAQHVAADFAIPVWTTRLEEVLERPDVQVIDLAVHASQRPPLVDMIASAGKHILSQKPFALNLADAQRMADVCRQAGVTVMVNQQARWAPAHRALNVLLERGVLGHLYSVLHVIRGFQDVSTSWAVSLQDFNILDHGVHYIDLTRYFTGRTPWRVKATTTMVPGQHAVTPMVYTILGEYPPDARLMTTLHFNNIVSTQAMHDYEWFLDGTEGSVSASHHEVVLSLKDNPLQRQVIKIQGKWFPDAWGGSMGEMLRALAEGREPVTSARDNLETLRVAYAAVESANSGRTVELHEPANIGN